MVHRYWVALLLVVLAGCSGEQDRQASRRPGASARPLVYASNYPLKYFAERISTPFLDVRLPVPEDVDPAFWKPTSEDVLVLQQADLIVLNGASYESWLKNVSLPASRLVDTSASFEERLITADGASTHSHGLEGTHEHSATAFTTWLDPTLAIEQARSIKDAFSARWPEHRGQFETQFEELAQELKALDEELEEIVKGAPGVPVVFSHPVYQYFARRFRVNGRSVHWEPDETPTDAMWEELADLTREHPAKCMIWEGRPLPETAARLTAMRIESEVFDPCARTPAQGDFLDVMVGNVETLRDVFRR